MGLQLLLLTLLLLLPLLLLLHCWCVRRDTEEDYESHVVPLLAKHKQVRRSAAIMQCVTRQAVVAHQCVNSLGTGLHDAWRMMLHGS
jgi:heme O synthase-like polyprenyltransferase